MRIEFQRAIAFDESLDAVNIRLRTEADNNHQRIKKRINDDYQAAQLIRAGLKEPEGTQIHKLAMAYYATYRKHNVPKETGSEQTLAELLEMEAGELESALQIKEVVEGKDGSENEN